VEGEEENILADNWENTRAEDQSGIQDGSLALSLTEVVHIGAKALLDINLTWFGYSARLSGGGGGKLQFSSNDL
jgi:hypothetical protein